LLTLTGGLSSGHMTTWPRARSYIFTASAASLTTYGAMRVAHTYTKSQEPKFPDTSPHSEVQQGIYALSPVTQANIVMLGDSLGPKSL